MLRIIVVIFALAICGVAKAQDDVKCVNNVEILDLDGNPAVIPHWGEKNLLIFYIDPDRAGMNQEFTEELESSGRAKSDKIEGIGIMNLKDAPFIPNGLARSMAAKRTESNGATVLSDQKRTLSKEWGLGDCNNLFVAIIINCDGEMLYMRKGVLSDSDKEEFYAVVERIK